MPSALGARACWQDCLTDASNNVFVNIFPTGKCTVTAANSRAQAEQVLCPRLPAGAALASFAGAALSGCLSACAYCLRKLI